MSQKGSHYKLLAFEEIRIYVKGMKAASTTILITEKRNIRSGKEGKEIVTVEVCERNNRLRTWKEQSLKRLKMWCRLLSNEAACMWPEETCFYARKAIFPLSGLSHPVMYRALAAWVKISWIFRKKFLFFQIPPGNDVTPQAWNPTLPIIYLQYPSLRPIH